MDAIIESNRLTKHYGKVTAVEDLSLRVARGEIYAFLGLNGAGKSTTIRMLLGMIKPTRGDVCVMGVQINARGEKPWQSIGYLVETPHAYPELTVRENLEVARRLHPGVNPGAIGAIIERMDLGAYENRRAATLSLGNAQRLGLARALLHEPKLLILDEPANGLDPAGIVEIRSLLRQLSHQQGVTVFMSSHILGEVSLLAQRIGIIHQGRLLQELDVEALQRNRQRQLLISTRDNKAARAILSSASFTVEPDQTGNLVITDETAILHPEMIAEQLVGAGYPPTLLLVEQENLEITSYAWLVWKGLTGHEQSTKCYLGRSDQSAPLKNAVVHHAGLHPGSSGRRIFYAHLKRPSHGASHGSH
jgi:ABC-2 type transport system ATP-binding protein